MFDRLGKYPLLWHCFSGKMFHELQQMVTGCIHLPLTSTAAGGSWGVCVWEVCGKSWRHSYAGRIFLQSLHMLGIHWEEGTEEGGGREQEGREGVRKIEKGWGGRAGGKEKGLAISNYWVINSRPHARYLHLHCLNFPQHGTMSVNEVMVFMATQWKGFCLHAPMAVTARGIVNPVGLSKFSLNDFNVLIKSSIFF